jgi:hypothetical protein
MLVLRLDIIGVRRIVNKWMHMQKRILKLRKKHENNNSNVDIRNHGVLKNA